MSRLPRPLLLPLVPLFRLAIALRALAYRSGWSHSRKLLWPVISVGSLSVGGAGKTPLVIHLANSLRDEGLRVDVLSRGYRRSGKSAERVDPAGRAEPFGDEPLLIARRTQLPVFVAASRYRAGLLAEQAAEHPGTHIGVQIGMHVPGVHVLDDGFQHRLLSRAVDVVLVTRADLEDCLLPAGNLREPLSALRRAEILVVRREERDLIHRLRKRGFLQPIWVIDRQLDVPIEVKRPFVFCGIARPDDFFAAVREKMEAKGGSVVGSQSFPDHHRYCLQDVQGLARSAANLHPDAFLTTEKDDVKLGGEVGDALRRFAPLAICQLRVVLEDEAEAMRELLKKLALDSRNRLKPMAPFV